jgi:hypothetical protein
MKDSFIKMVGLRLKSASTHGPRTADMALLNISWKQDVIKRARRSSVSYQISTCGMKLAHVLIELSRASTDICRTYFLMLHCSCNCVSGDESISAAIYCLLNYPNKNHLLYVNAQRHYMEADEGENTSTE